MDESPESRIRDLEFLLRREKLENRKNIKEILYQILDISMGLERLLLIAQKQQWPEEAQKFVQERFVLVNKKLLQTLLRSGAIKINSLGQALNREYHEVLEEVYNPDVPEGNIVEVKQEGYIFEGEILRTAKVKVATSTRND